MLSRVSAFCGCETKIAMRFKFVFWLFLIADCVFVRVQSRSDDFSYKKRFAVRSRIAGGEKYQSKDDLDHPWLVGLHNRLYESFFCAGSLISNRHVLSAAHCFQPKGETETTDPYHVMAMLGRFNVSDHDEAGSLNSLVWEIFIHPEWKFIDWGSNFDADISVVVLIDLVEFTEFIRPVRLPEPSEKYEVEGTGTVVGWGKDNNSSKLHEETPSQIKIPAVLFIDCVLGAKKLVDGLSRRTFCAGFRGRAIAPCAGDSGGGFYVEDENKQNSIEGIVSNSIQDTPGECKTDIYTVHTIVANFVPWIKEKVQETKERVVIDVEYTCEVMGVVLDGGSVVCEPKENDNHVQHYVKLKLRHYRGDPKDVRTLFFDFGPTKVIEGIGETFPNLEELQCTNDDTPRVERRTFANMTKLKKLELHSNELITSHYFNDLVNLEWLSCSHCRMPKQPRNLFNVLRNLKVLNLARGAGFRILPDETFANMSKFEVLALNRVGLEEITENAFNDLVGLKKLNLRGNLIAKLPAGLFKNLRSLEMMNFEDNKIEELPEGLFTNNLKLEDINFSGNKIKKIETDFTSLPKIRAIHLIDNVCVNEDFGWHNLNKKIQEVQEIVDRKCNPK